ncbi:MAG TPA: SpoIID/LytB domain-containing protein [Candidatus Kapabacteria bacterium]|nr:SpoIID/LytB domain-containing protein [Candidatus Kapabacteria bacterium]
MMQFSSLIRWGMFSILFTLCAGSLAAQSVSAAGTPVVTIRDKSYAARFVSQSIPDPVTIEAGQTKSITFTFKNTGTATWNEKGKHYLSAYTMEPRDRKSVFTGKTWISSKQTGKVAGTVKPGATGTLTIDFVAPAKTGDYVEKFYLASENNTWVDGGYFFVKLTVVPKTAVKTPSTSATPAATTTVSSAYKANRFMQSVKQVTAKGGERVELVIAFQNVGTKPWTEYALTGGSPTRLASTGATLSFADDLWEGPNLVLKRQKTVEPNAIFRETFTFRTPAKAGTYTANFGLQVNGTSIDDAMITIPVTVTEDAPGHVPDSALLPPSVSPLVTPEIPRLSAEPRIRVGIWKPDTFVQFRSEEDTYIVYDGETPKGILPLNRLGVMKYENGQYAFSGGDLDFTTTNYIRLAPETNPHAVFTLWNFNNRVTWKGGSRNFNQYHGALEYRLTKDGKDLYVINDLLLEDYVLGIAETSNNAPLEMQKAQAVAARTYAYYVATYSDKHDARNFDVVSHTGDQLYLGYVSEGITPNYTAGARETRGYMVTYNNAIVITPYFGNTDGRTRSWTEVWGGSQKPWLVPVTANYDVGKNLYGHGVGMSQRDAAYRAEKEGMNWIDLVKYYYTGVQIEKIYH